MATEQTTPARGDSAIPSADRPRVAIVQTVILAYRERFYELLRDHLEAAGVELVVVHSNPPSSMDLRQDVHHLDWAHRVESRIFRIGNQELVWQPYSRLVREADLVVVEQASRLLLNYCLLAAQRLGRQRVAFWGHGKNFDLVGRSRLGEAAKRWLTPRAHWWFAYAKETAEIVASMGYPRERITVVRNATDSRSLTRAIARVAETDVEALRVELGVNGPNVGIYLGGLNEDKQLGYLVGAADQVRLAVPDFELIIAGNGAAQAEMIAAADARPWMIYAGRKDGDALAALLRLPKLLLVPSRAGLVVVDSFAAGVPLISRAVAGHGPEIAYVRDGINGVLVDDNDGDMAIYARAVTGLLLDESRRLQLVRGCEAARAVYNAENMASRFCDGILAALETQGRPDRSSAASSGSAPESHGGPSRGRGRPRP